jgi:hypothetical protein
MSCNPEPYKKARHHPSNPVQVRQNHSRLLAGEHDGSLASSARQAEWGGLEVHRLLSLWVFGDVIYAVLPLPPGDEDFSHRWRVIKPMVTQRCQTRLNGQERG